MVWRRSALTLRSLVEHMADVSAPRHRELMRGMVSELDSIDDPAERRRFAVGAIAAMVRLTLRGYGGTTVHAPADDANLGGPAMSQIPTGQLLRRHAAPLGVTFAALTGLLLASQAARRIPELSARGLPAGRIVEALLLAIPHTIALTIPMAVFVAVTWVFTRLAAEGLLASVQRERHAFRRLVTPVLGAAAIIAGLTFVSNTQIVPRTNTRLAALLADAPQGPTDRTMTIGELRDAAQRAQTSAAPTGAARAAAYEVEIHKKFALAAACIFLALAGAAIALRFPRFGMGLVMGASGVVFTGYYASLVAGESLADRLMISPFVAMWMANGFLLAVVLLLVWRPGPRAAVGAPSVAIGS